MSLTAFHLSRVTLASGPVRERQELNMRYLLELDQDRLLHTFRIQSGLPSAAEPLGGWESPDCGLRGHFVGHYLSACAQVYAATGDARLRDRALGMLSALATCQDAIGSGYLSAFPESDLDAIESRFEGAWASYYVLHKLLAGLLDVHRHCASAESLRVAERLGDYIRLRIGRLSAEQIEGMCRTDTKPNPTNEVGGIGEALQDLADATGRAEFDRLAAVFDRDWFVTPLLLRDDRLTGLHANTHIQMALALARRYERQRDISLRQAVEFFWERTALARTYVNGGSSGPRPDGTEKSHGGEHWPAPFTLAGTLTPKINESCVTHNMLRLTDALLRWTGDARYANFAERAYVNHVLAMQHPGRPGGYLYDHPLGSTSCKKFGHALDSFWCCYGSSVEAFARLSTGIFYSGDETLWIAQFVACTLDWTERGLVVSIEPIDRERRSVRVVVRSARTTALTLRIRRPAWTERLTATLNGSSFATTDNWLKIHCTWEGEQTLTLDMPMAIWTEAMPDDPSKIAFGFGPHVLAALTDRPLDLAADYSLQQDGGQFSIRLADGAEVPLIPLNEVVDQMFGVYFQLVSTP